MNDQTKKTVKAIALSLGITLIIASIVIIIYKTYQKGKDDKKEDQSDDTNPYLPKSSGSQSSSESWKSNYFNGEYTESEVKKMQGWLLSTATLKGNSIIVKAINDSGKVDGKMGTGFNTALHEAISKGYVKDLNDLYSKSKS